MLNPLLPNRHPNQDLFICDWGEVIPKSDIASMEHPLFTLSTKPDKAIRHYAHNENTVTITPSVLGLATIHDKDILIYCISQLMAGINQGEKPNRRIRFRAHDLLITTNRPTGGESYIRLNQAFSRLSGTLIETNIKTNKTEINEKFHILDHVKTIYSTPNSKRMVEMEVTLSEWLYNSVLGQEVLSINRMYFRLRKPIDRRIYEIARKHCGKQQQWQIGLDNLHKKVGSASTLKKFKEIINHLVRFGHLPDYRIRLEAGNVVFNYEGKEVLNQDGHGLFLKTETIERAKKILGRNLDVYAIEAEWQAWWIDTGKPEITSADGAFINFCKVRMGIKV
jgi:plasmid replication initiation protein